MTNSSKTLTWRGQYYPFGQMRYQMVSATNNLRYPGQWADDEVGLYYNRHRHYHPSWGRYWEADPIGIHGREANPYIYGLDNPLRYSDPSGLSSQNGFWAKWWNNVQMTHEGIGFLVHEIAFAPLAHGIARETGWHTVEKWIFRQGWRGILSNGIKFTRLESSVIMLSGGLQQALVGGLFLEAGIGIGSIISVGIDEYNSRIVVPIEIPGASFPARQQMCE